MYRSPLLPSGTRAQDDRPVIRIRNAGGEMVPINSEKRSMAGFTDLALTGDPVDAEMAAAILNAPLHKAWVDGRRDSTLGPCAPLAAMEMFAGVHSADFPQRDHDALLAIALWLRTFDPDSDELADACDVAAATARRAGANEPPWAGDEGRFEVVGCYALYEPGKAWRDLHLGFRAPCGTEHSIVTTSTGGARPELANLKVEAPIDVLAEAFSRMPATPSPRHVAYDPVTPARAIEILEEQLERARATRYDRLWTGGGFPFLPMLDSRMRAMRLAVRDGELAAPFEA